MTSVRPSLRGVDLVLPVFVKEGLERPEPVASMPGVSQHTLDSLLRTATDAAEAGVAGLLLFGVPTAKDPVGSQADAVEGITQRAFAKLRAEVGDAILLIGDVCLCEYTDHGHCGPLTSAGAVDADAAVARYAATAVAQADAGAAVVAPSGMQAGQVGAMRGALDAAGHRDVAILGYSAKYASTFYGPFRDAAESAPAFGDRRGYQLDPDDRGAVRALAETDADLAEGADAVMVKPAGPYLDVLRRVADHVAALPEERQVPVFGYQVSGEDAMVAAAAANGWLDRRRTVDESVLAIRRAGADGVITYWATELAGSAPA